MLPSTGLPSRLTDRITGRPEQVAPPGNEPGLPSDPELPEELVRRCLSAESPAAQGVSGNFPNFFSVFGVSAQTRRSAPRSAGLVRHNHPSPTIGSSAGTYP